MVLHRPETRGVWYGMPCRRTVLRINIGHLTHFTPNQSFNSAPRNTRWRSVAKHIFLIYPTILPPPNVSLFSRSPSGKMAVMDYAFEIVAGVEYLFIVLCIPPSCILDLDSADPG
jgi:hypothetical protein